MPQDSPIGQLSQAMIDSLPQHLALLDQAGRIVAINCSWQKFSSEISGVRLGIGDDYLPACQNLGYEKGLAATGVRAVLAGAEEFKLEYACVGRWGERWFLMQVTPLPRTLGGAVVSHLDITSRKQLETERARWQAEALQTHEAAEVASHAKDEWLAQIMHDLRSPLSAILGWTKVMRSRTLDQDKQAEALAIIEQSAEKQKALIEDLLDLSRIVAGKLRLEVGPVSLSAVMHSAMEVMKPACDAKAVKYDVELATEADAITGDPARLEQVIWNLVSNAVKFTPHNGRVLVRLERADPMVRITVSDTGKGIKAEDLPYVFQRYWQSNEASGRRTGLGLGLSFVKHIVELHGGTVAVESKGEGQGAKFAINLPYAAVGAPHEELHDKPTDELTNAAPARRASSNPLGGLLIVVADDEADARELVATVLQQQGAEVLTADSAEAAFQLIVQSACVPHLLISDIGMPGEDGYTLISRVRNLLPERGGRVPSLALTAFGREEDRMRALTAGFQMYLSKPVEPTELVLVAANLTGREIEDFQL